METEIKKRKHRKGGTDYAKEKLAKAEAKVMTLESQLANAKEEARRTKYELEKKLNEEVSEHQALERKYNEMVNDRYEISETIRKQGTKISELSGDLANAQSEAREYRSKFEEAVRRMGWLRRFIYGYNFPQFTDEDHWHD